MSCTPLIFTDGEFHSDTSAWLPLPTGIATVLAIGLTISYLPINMVKIVDNGRSTTFPLGFDNSQILYKLIKRNVLMMRISLNGTFLNVMYYNGHSTVPIFSQAGSFNAPDLRFPPIGEAVFQLNFNWRFGTEVACAFCRTDNGILFWSSQLIFATDIKAVVQSNILIESGFQIAILAINPTKLLKMVPVPCL